MVGEDEKLTSKTRVDLVRLPPCHSALKPHVLRVNHRVALYTRADEPILEKPKPYDDGQGWIYIYINYKGLHDDGVLESVRSWDRSCPTKLIG